MKKFLKVLGLALAGLFGLIAVAVAVAAITGVFSDEEIKIESLTWEVSKVRVVDDYTVTVNFLPENANALDIELKPLTAGAENIVEIPTVVKAGTPFTIKLKKDANGNNIGGEVKIQAKTSLVVTDPNLDILVDVPIPNDGLLIASDHDSLEDDKTISAGASEFGLYVYTNPNMALNPNTGLVPDLAENYKDITIKSTNTSELQILNTTGEVKEGFYCPNYIEHGHKGPFKDSNGNALTQYCNGKKLEKYKYIEYRAKAITSTAVDTPVIVTAKALRTYSMQEMYVSKNDPKYLTESGSFEGAGREQYYTDLSNYVNEFKDYIISDTRKNYDSQNSSLVNYESGADFIASVTQINDAGESYIKISENRIQEEAAYFYFYVECRTIFNIEDIEVKNVTTNLQSSVEYNLHGNLQQYTVDDLKTTFGLSLIASNSEFNESDLSYRYRDIRIISIMDKDENSESTYNFDYANFFEIENPSSTVNPVWKIRAINPISSAEASRNPRLRFYIPSSETKEFSNDDPYVDVAIIIQEIQIEELTLVNNGDDMINSTMIINTSDYNGYSYRQLLDSSRYILKGVGGQTPTYTTVKFFVTEESAKTKYEGTDTSFFKVRLNNDDKTPTLKTMPYGNSSVKGYEIAYQFNGQTYLEAINITNGNDLQVFAAVIKTDYTGRPVDSNGISEGEEGYNGIYQIMAKSTNNISITINNYLEKLNFYTVNSDNVYSLRNVQATGTATQDTIQLLAGQDYELKVSPFYLTKSGEIDLTNAEYADSATIDYKTNIMVATKNAMNSAEILFNTDSDDFTYDAAPTLNSDVFVYDVNITALVNTTGNPNEKRDADFNAYGIGSISNSFDRTKSTVNMFVNYASIDSLQLRTNVNTQKSEYVLYPVAYTMTQDGTPEIKWIEESERQDENSQEFTLQTYYSFDIQNQTDNNGILSYGPKIDKELGTSAYVNSYIKEYLNYSNSNAVNISWDLQLISGGEIGETVDSYIRIIEEQAPEGSEHNSITNLSIEKGTKQGVVILATCTIKLYNTSGDNYIEQKQASIQLKLIQSDVEFELYSPKIVNGQQVVVKNGTDALAFEVVGGGTDGTTEGTTDNEAKGYNLLRDFGTQKLDIYDYVNGQYILSEGQTSQYVKVTMGEDGELSQYCTYTIDTLSNPNPAIYFLNENVEKVYSMTVTNQKSLRFYAEYVSEDTTVKITIASPFKDAETKSYYVKVLSSIDLTVPDGNIVVSTTANKDGVDLTQYFKAKRGEDNLNIGFEIVEKNGVNGNIYADLQATDEASELELTNDTEKTYTPLTKFVPYEVYSQKVVYMNLLYFVPEEVDVYNDKGEFIETKTVYVKNVISNNDKINVIVNPGYAVECANANITNKETTTFTLTSGNTLDMFDSQSCINASGYNITSGFIKITNKSTNQTISEDDISKTLSKLITLSYDVSALDPADKDIFDTLFDTTSDKNQIEKGKIITKSIASNLVIPIKVLFKEGSADSYSATIDPIFTFYLKVEASVDFYINKTTLVDGATYSQEKIKYDNIDYGGTQIGHIIKNINVDSNGDGVIELGNYELTLFDSSSKNNIISLHGISDSSSELLNKMYKTYYLYKFVDGEFKLVESDDKVSVLVTKTQDQEQLSKLVLSITNAVNQTTHYKLAISTTINKDNETFDYYFTIEPTYSLRINYPLVTEVEKVRVGTRVNLLENYINFNNRIEIYQDKYTFTLGKVNDDGKLYSLTTTNDEYNKTFELLTVEDNPITFTILSGSAHVDYSNSLYGEIVFDSFTTTASTQEVVVRVELFNGVYIDYKFELYKSLTITSFTAQQNINVYADTTVNLYDYLTLTSTPPEDFKYVIKYTDNNLGAFVVGDSSNIINNANTIINYSGAEINIKFYDTTKVVQVGFSVWHNYSVSGEQCVKLWLTLHPNLQVTVNQDANGNNKVQQIVANTSTVLMSNSDDTWLKISNEDLTGISMVIASVDGNANWESGKTFEYSITKDQTANSYTFTSNNIGIAKTLVFAVTKTFNVDATDGSDKTYSLYFEIQFVPNINLNSSFIGASVYDLEAAASSDTNGVKQVTLNNVAVNDGYLINPTDYFGNALSVVETSTNQSYEVASFSVEGVYLDKALKQRIVTSNQDNAKGIVGCSASDAKINLTLKARNDTLRIYIKIEVRWHNNTEEVYTAVLNLNIVPNLKANEESVTYSEAGNVMTVLAGSEIKINYTADNKVTFNQNNNSATINAYQTTADGETKNANVVFKAESSDNVLYELSNGNVIRFKGVSKPETINVFYYLDLSGNLIGVVSSSNFDDATKIHYNDQNKNPNNYTSQSDKEKYYTRKITFKIVPSIKAMGYADLDVVPSTPENARDITTNFKSLYLGESITTNDKFSITSDANGNVVAQNGEVEVNGYKIAELFDFTPVSNASFADDKSVKLYKELLYLGFDYSAVLKLGNYDDTWGGLSVATDDATNYFFVDKAEGIIYFIPPALSVTNTVWLEVTVSVLAENNITLSKVVYFKFQYSGTQTSDGKTEYIGNGGQILSVSSSESNVEIDITGKAFDNVNSALAKGYFEGSDTNEENKGIDLNRVFTVNNVTQYQTEYSLNNYFKFGYLLRTTTSTSSEETQTNSTEGTQSQTSEGPDLKKYKEIEASGKTYYYYLLENIKMNFALKGDSASYASIDENGLLTVEPYYVDIQDPSNVDIDEFRKITIAVSAGPIVTEFEIDIYPIKVKHGFSYDNTNNEFSSKLTGVKNTTITIKSNTIEMLNTGFTDNEYEIYEKWLSSNKFTPDASVLYEKTTFTFKNTIVVDYGSGTQTFTKTCNVDVEPEVGLSFNYENKKLVVGNTYRVISGEEASRLINSSIFEFESPTVKITEIKDDSTATNYSDYVEFSQEFTDGSIVIRSSDLTMTVKSLTLKNDITLKYKIEISYKKTSNGSPINLEKIVTLVIGKNIGITGLQSSYTCDFNNAENNMVTISLKPDESVDNVIIVGGGSINKKTITVKVANDDVGVYGTFNGVINDYIEVNVGGDGKQITSIQINYSKLLALGTVTGLFKLKLEFYYEDILVQTVMVTQSQAS